MAESKHNPLAEMARKAGLEEWFPTPVFRYVLGNVTELNARLRELILAREREIPSETKSNQGGWQSGGDFFRWPDPAIDMLARYVSGALDLATAKLALPAEYEYRFAFYGWAAVNRAGDYNITHVHPMATWSGVYYVDAGDADDPGSGLLELSHPSTAAVMTFFPGLLPSERTVRPEDGLLVLFPSYVQHAVRRYTGRRPRICVPFNAHLQLVPRAAASGGR